MATIERQAAMKTTRDRLRAALNVFPVEKGPRVTRRGLGDVLFPVISRRDRRRYGVEPPPFGF